MLRIDTSGSWNDMGRQVGETFDEELEKCVTRFVGILEESGRDIDREAREVRPAIEAICPELIEETAGMAEGSGIAEDRLFKHRFYVSLVSPTPDTGCSSFFALGPGGEPWLGRTCDIEPEDHWCHLCHVRRPDKGIATVTTTYLGFAGGPGVNAHGLGVVGVSASTPRTYGDAGVPSTILLHRVLDTCRDLEEANRLMIEQPVLGKGQLWLAADPGGMSALYPIAPGKRIVPIPRATDRPWQACTNFQPSKDVPSLDNPLVMYNSYSRYGRLTHRLEQDAGTYTVEGLQQLLRDVSQPGPCIPEGAYPHETCCATLFDLRGSALHLAPGNPNKVPFEEIAFA